MISTFINPVVNPDQRLGVTAFTETAPVRRWQMTSPDELDAVIRAVYKQVLGNAYVMESERAQVPESQFRRGELSVVEFIRALAKSDVYRTRFFENGSRNRFIELNFKHLLGRAPESRAEMAHHSAILDKGGYDAEIDAYLDSAEYAEAFGEETVPYYRGYKTGAINKLVGFTHLFPLLRGASSSDKNVVANNPARLPRTLFADEASSVVFPSGATSRRGSGEPVKTGDWLSTLFTPAAVVGSADSAIADSAVSPFDGLDDSELAAKARSQSELIGQLRKQLDTMRSLSTMGAAMLRKGQLPSTRDDDSTAQVFFGSSALEQQVSDQAQEIDKLRGELMSARSLSTIAEFNLNKWRARSY